MRQDQLFGQKMLNFPSAIIVAEERHVSVKQEIKKNAIFVKKVASVVMRRCSGMAALQNARVNVAAMIQKKMKNVTSAFMDVNARLQRYQKSVNADVNVNIRVGVDVNVKF